MPLATELFDYPLPPRLIAQTPAERRDRSRLLVVDRASHTVSHSVFAELPSFLRRGDVLIRNNASVLPSRMRLKRPTSGSVECFLLEAISGSGKAGEVWRCLLRPARKVPIGETLLGPGGALSGELVARQDGGLAEVRFTTQTGEPVAAAANRIGEIPLPPYILRAPGPTSDLDRERYQTIYADPARPVAVAAPTAGLHFTPELLSAIETSGVRTADLTLNVGLGTFRPIATDTVEAHPIHRESYAIPEATQLVLLDSKRAAGRRVAVGTTTVRAAEDFLEKNNSAIAGLWAAEASVFLYPPRAFRGFDVLITNFHQPRSTLLCLVAAFLAPGSTEGIGWIKEIYAEAVARDYRFLSYGDAMLIV